MKLETLFAAKTFRDPDIIEIYPENPYITKSISFKINIHFQLISKNLRNFYIFVHDQEYTPCMLPLIAAKPFKYNLIRKVIIILFITQFHTPLDFFFGKKRDFFSSLFHFFLFTNPANIYVCVFVCVYVCSCSFGSLSKITAMNVRSRYAHTHRQSPQLFCHVTHAAPALPPRHSRHLQRAQPKLFACYVLDVAVALTRFA